jgi:hypothetical protein
MLRAMLGEAWLAMGANRMRTILTMLGMVIGVGSVVLMMAIGQGAQYAVAQTIKTMGSNLYILISGSTSTGGVRSGGGGGPTLTLSPTPRRSPNSTAWRTSRRCIRERSSWSMAPTTGARRWSARRRPISTRAPGP